MACVEKHAWIRLVALTYAWVIVLAPTIGLMFTGDEKLAVGAFFGVFIGGFLLSNPGRNLVNLYVMRRALYSREVSTAVVQQQGFFDSAPAWLHILLAILAWMVISFFVGGFLCLCGSQSWERAGDELRIGLYIMFNPFGIFIALLIAVPLWLMADVCFFFLGRPRLLQHDAIADVHKRITPAAYIEKKQYVQGSIDMLAPGEYIEGRIFFLIKANRPMQRGIGIHRPTCFGYSTYRQTQWRKTANPANPNSKEW